ncbi:MAG: cupin [Aquificota bacterium]|uniref:Helix-turn-helix domain-containing protein n=1 Tax=Thermosulfidibacter takaii TaxID=412593 RepID=A0A7C0U753_9BACT|nr:MAG: cupin [Aquificota bacterium]RLD97747.1 MAG: cupin [Aquificota bacterium]RLD99849.1 MAG: cupin [Aquificota bacterium]HDD53430.1 helix-turn-helix domain-containing protein [Thermosulfidibacter takaii]
MAGKMEIGRKLRRLRKSRALTLEEVAQRANLTKGFLSQIERDKASPSVAALKQILDVLGEDLSTFFQDAGEPEKNVFRVEEREPLDEDIPGVIMESLAPDIQYREMDPILITMEKGAKITDEDLDEEEAFGYLLEGEAWITIEGESYKLKKGDTFYLFPETEFVIENKGKERAQILVVAY